jgi:hypothetical protein
MNFYRKTFIPFPINLFELKIIILINLRNKLCGIEGVCGSITWLSRFKKWPLFKKEPFHS